MRRILCPTGTGSQDLIAPSAPALVMSASRPHWSRYRAPTRLEFSAHSPIFPLRNWRGLGSVKDGSRERNAWLRAPAIPAKTVSSCSSRRPKEKEFLVRFSIAAGEPDWHPVGLAH